MVELDANDPVERFLSEVRIIGRYLRDQLPAMEASKSENDAVFVKMVVLAVTVMQALRVPEKVLPMALLGLMAAAVTPQSRRAAWPQDRKLWMTAVQVLEELDGYAELVKPNGAPDAAELLARLSGEIVK